MVGLSRQANLDDLQALLDLLAEEDETIDIATPKADIAPSALPATYNLQGRRILNGQTKKGIYIVNNKKYITLK